jgi:proteasome lid subunit RPN8/RPN11
MPDIFRITQRQYDIVIRQTLENLPRESGGFLGGSDDMIKGLLPVYNQAASDSTTSFEITSEDIERAHRFFKKHNLTYYGVYHSHPKGIPEPSTQDLRNIQRYHFIIGLVNPKDPVFAAYEASGFSYSRIPIQIVDDKGVTVLDLKAGSKLSENAVQAEVSRLEQIYNDILHERATYPVLEPISPANSQFSTLA